MSRRDKHSTRVEVESGRDSPYPTGQGDGVATDWFELVLGEESTAGRVPLEVRPWPRETGVSHRWTKPRESDEGFRIGATA